MKLFSLLFLTLILTWLEFSTADETNPYRHIENLDSEGKYVVEWEVNWKLEEISFRVTAETKGYIGFGLSAKGDLEGADVVIGGVGRNGRPYFSDQHGVANDLTQVDQTQDWQLNAFSENRTHTSLNFSRKFETCDENDYPIGDDLINLIWTIGESDNYRRWNSCASCRPFHAYLLDKDFTPSGIQQARIDRRQPEQDELNDLKIWTISKRQKLPARDTAYWCSYHKAPTLNRKHHLVGFNFRWEAPEEFDHTHHLLLYKCNTPSNVDQVSLFEPHVRNNTGEECYFLSNHNGQLPTQYCTEIKYAYAIGQRMFFLPNEAGIPFGESPNEYYLLQVHYDNPEQRSDIEYEVNIDMYYTPKLRPSDGGLMTIGHHIPGFPSILVPYDSPEHIVHGHCGSDCTNQILPAEGIKLLGIQLHTHNTGQRFRLKHFRGDVELPWISNDDNYDHNFQPTRSFREEVTILPGDHVVARCVYNVSANASLVGGFSTRSEMCLTYVWYYNKLQDINLCRSEIRSQEYLERHLDVTNVTWSYPHLQYTVTSPPYFAGLTVTQVADYFTDWTREKREQLQMDHMTFPQVNDCSAAPFSTAGINQGQRGQTFSVANPVGVKEYMPRSRVEECESRHDTRATLGKRGWGRSRGSQRWHSG